MASPALTAAGYLPAAGAALIATLVLTALAVLLTRKRITWHAQLDMPVELTSPRATSGIVLGTTNDHPGGARTSGRETGWLVVLGISNRGLAAIRSDDFSVPMTFTFPGREILATQLLPMPAGSSSGLPLLPPPPAAIRSGPVFPASGSAAQLQLSYGFLLRPRDSYLIMLVLSGLPAAGARAIEHDGTLAHGRIRARPVPAGVTEVR